jgi:uncharacterized membrane protein
MRRTVAVVILLGLVAIFSLIVLSPWIIEGPRRFIRRFVSRKSDNRASDVVVHNLTDSLVDVPTSVR